MALVRTRALAVAACCVVLLLAGGCNRCPSYVVFAVHVLVLHADRTPAPAAIVNYTVDGAAPDPGAQNVHAMDSDEWLLGSELSGAFHIVATEGARTASADLTIARNSCNHPDEMSVTITLPP